MANPSPLPAPATQFTSENRITDPERYLSPLAQLKRMQRVLYQHATNEKTAARDSAMAAGAWERLEERKRVMVGKPAPKPIEMPIGGRRSRPKARQSDSAFEDPTQGASKPE